MATLPKPPASEGGRYNGENRSAEKRGELVDRGGEADDDFGCVGVSGGKIDGAKGEVASAEVALDAAAPGADEREIENAADYRAG